MRRSDRKRTAKHSENDAGGESRSRGLVRIRLPRLTISGKPASDGSAQLANELLRALTTVTLQESRCALVTSLVAGSEDDLPAEEWTESHRIRLARCLDDVLSNGVGGEARIQIGEVTLCLQLAPEDATAGRGKQGDAVETVPDAIVESLAREFASKLEGLPTDYASRRASLAELSEATREAIGKAIESSLNEEAAKRPQESYEDKKAVAAWVNAELRELGGLAIRCPKTGQPALLRANPISGTDKGRYQFEITDSAGGRHRTVTSASLPPLELMANDLRRAPYGERTGRSR